MKSYQEVYVKNSPLSQPFYSLVPPPGSNHFQSLNISSASYLHICKQKAYVAESCLEGCRKRLFLLLVKAPKQKSRGLRAPTI